ncbi:MAG: transcription-repair coupling factor [Gammaproteobacteria bacterium]|nr:MAG: transcription-repair coupling factor [Gammaproteobacteria bacterium]RLA50466.1 MAG: transcription-repair coupling factor [Gammaproteobacteria bacterium]
MPSATLSAIPASAPGDRRQWSGLHGAASALAIVSAAKEFDGLTLVIANSAKSAATLQNELCFFSAGSDDLPILHFPDWETLPYDLFSPHQDIISERLATLYRLPNLRKGILVVPVTTTMHRLAPPQFIAGNSFVYKIGEKLDIGALRQQLQFAGYRCVDTVCEHGEYAVRGALIDVFPMGSTLPIRIDLFDDEIETLRSFDPETQLTAEKVSAIKLLPGREFPRGDDGIKRFLDNWHLQFDVDPRACQVYQDTRSGILSNGIEYYLPLFFDECATLFDHLPSNTMLFTEQGINEAAQSFWHEANDRYINYGVDPARPLLKPSKVFIPVEEWFATLGKLPRTDFLVEPAQKSSAIAPCFNSLPTPDVSIDAKADKPLAKLEQYLLAHKGKTLICAESAGRREILLEMLAAIDIAPQHVDSWADFITTEAIICICVFPLDRGLEISQPSLGLISETELFGQQILQRRRRHRSQDGAELFIKNLTELQLAAPVVHVDHGIGRYQGLEIIDIEGEPQEFVTLSYAEGAKLYVPVANLHLISRYSGGDDELAPLHRLGSEQWQKARDKAARQIRDTAAELLVIYAKRAAQTGFKYEIPVDDYRAFSAEFPFEETPDQFDAIAAVRDDMAGEQPMDRLICGDVGFGKTEVAMRAAFLAVTNSKQVVILVPTTLLAQQHYDNFRDRFANWPVTIEVISRFKTSKEQNNIIEQTNAGQIDILIGTHKLLNQQIDYPNLGLLVIDEEHRFGVNQKEKIKSLRSEVDILTLTATPIPRTLNMAMGSLRDLSIIATPPARRLSVKTFVHQTEMRIVHEAILRELLRGGQVYYLHNDVKSIDRTAEELRQLLPDARIAIAHGQMRERELEKVMSDFYHQRTNILVCTTIIETGIDVPSANTIIINRADKLGLAQLHQLRGRVGRSHHQAYAYLLTPHPKQMSTDAHKRLEAIAAADHLGSGFTLATHDLEIRGAGELLGDGQSGHIHSIGFSLYMELLERTVTAMRNGESPDGDLELWSGAEVNLNIPALIPDDYVADIHNRLILYKRIGNASSEVQLRELQVEMIDRFGLLPENLKNLFRVTALRQRVEELGISRLDAGPAGGKVEFCKHTPIEPMTIVELVQRHPEIYRLQSATQLRFNIEMFSAEERLQTVADLLDLLTPQQKQVA